MGQRLGIDLGTNSLGWALLQDNGDHPVSVKAASVRIFSDGREPAAEGKTGDPLAVERRIARGARRRRDRMLGRKDDVRNLLLEYGLFPSDPQEQEKLKDLNPHELRDKAVREALTPEELARTLIHLSQRRGFKSNRKGDKTAEKEEEKKGQTKDREDLDKILKDRNITLGQYLWEEYQKGEGTRARLGKAKYPQRAQYIAEFEKIRDTQKPHHKLTDEQWNALNKKLFDQRPLREAQRGLCQIYFDEIDPATNKKYERAYKALPTWQKFRVLQNLMHLRLVTNDRGSEPLPLNKEQISFLYRELMKKKSMGFTAIRKELKKIKGLELPDDRVFSLEQSGKDSIEGNETGYTLSVKDKKKNKEYFGDRWHEFSDEMQDDIVWKILDEEDTEKLQQCAVTEWGCTNEQAENIASLKEGDFASGCGRYSLRALREINEKLTQQGISVKEATDELIRLKKERNGNIGDNLPLPALEYYGKVIPESMIPAPLSKVDDEKIYGKINNPTVHIALNQLRKVINELIETHGKPDEIIVELSRELKLSGEAKEELEKFNEYQKRDNIKIKKELIEGVCGESGAFQNENQISNNDIKKYKLWRELDYGGSDRCCFFCGKKIGFTELYNDNIVQIEHILPESKTYDDSYNNLTVAHTWCNKDKGERSPYEALSRPDWNKEWSYDEMLAKVEGLMKPNKNGQLRPYNAKRWRFYKNAMKQWSEQDNGFLARQLTDTQYLAKIATKYLKSLYPDDGKIHVRVLPGQLTAKLRHQWGLNAILTPNTQDNEEKAKKNRNDHRHHAIDAIVVACTDQGLLQKASKASGQGRIEKLTFDPPWDRDQFFHDVKRVIEGITVSHKPDHGIEGRLNEGTNYGILKSQDGTIERQNDYERENEYNIVTRKDFLTFFGKEGGAKALKKVAEIRAPAIRKDLESLLSKDMTATEVEKIIGAYAKEKNIKRVRVLGKEKGIIPIRHGKDKQHVRGIISDGNHHVAFWRMPDGKTEWWGHSYLDVNKVKGDMNKLKPHPAAKLICRVHVGDMVRVERDGQTITCRVKSLAPSDSNQSMTLQEHSVGEGQTFKMSLNQPAKYKFRKIFLTPAGKIHDGGTVF